LFVEVLCAVNPVPKALMFRSECAEKEPKVVKKE
jgi:hypothetical protein